MLTRIFATSKSSNFLWVSGYLLSLYILKLFRTFPKPYTLWDGIIDATFAILLIFSVLLVDFIVRKNDLSKKNSYVILLYTCILGLLPLNELVPKLFLGHLFILLAYRRIISLASGKSIKKKIFDASIWISLASILYVWNHGIFLIVFLGVLFFSSQDYRNWLVPFFGAATCILFLVVGTLVFTDHFPDFIGWWEWPDLDFTPYLNPNLLLPIATIGLLSIGSGIYYLLVKQKLVFKTRRVPILMFYTLVVALAVALTGTKLTLAAWVVTSFPLAVIATFSAEQHQQKIITEIVLWALVLLPWINEFVF